MSTINVPDEVQVNFGGNHAMTCTITDILGKPILSTVKPSNASS